MRIVQIQDLCEVQQTELSKMKLLVVLALIPLALAAVPMEKRFIFDSIDTGALSTMVHSLVSTLGTDDNEAICERTCHSIVVGDETALIHTFCSPICHSLQTLAAHFGATAKRNLFGNLLNLDGLSTMVSSLVHMVGADATEQACEGACHSIVVGPETGLIHTFCSPICHSLQSLALHFDHTPTEATIGKRAFLSGLLNLDGLSTMVNDLVHLGALDATEQICEEKCHGVILGPETSLLHTFCPSICRSLQALVQHFDHTPTEATIGKRAFLGGLIDTTILTGGLQQLLDFVGTDASEEVCEMGCHNVVVGGETALFHTFCRPICRSLQTLVHTFHLAPSATTAAP